VTDVKPDGQTTVKLAVGGPPGMGVDLIEGIYMAVLSAQPLRQSLTGASLVRVDVLEVSEGGARLQIGKEAAKKTAAGNSLLIFRPQGATTAQLKAAPEIAALTDAKADKSGLTRGSLEDLAKSQNNLKMIGLAMHNFHDVYGTFPPAVIYGPDGKPWHSWRVLVLPFLEQQPLYEKYRFDEPWNGPNNSKLLENIPPMYRDSAHGEPMDYFTHYAAATGKGVAFPAEGISFDGKPENLLTSDKKGGGGKLRLSSFTDGTSNSLLVGSVSPGRKIPWMKPEDVTVDADFPAPGKPGKGGKETGFAAPYQSPRGSAGVFLFADGSVQTITDAVPVDAFRNLLTIADGMPTDRNRLPTLAGDAAGGPTIAVIRIESTAAGPLARLSQEPALQTPAGDLSIPVPTAPRAPTPR
jgi:hypothetical protein